MKKYHRLFSVILIFLVKSAFSQDTYFGKLGFTTQQIDSIAAINGRTGIAEGQINAAKNHFEGGKKQSVKGEGQSTVAVYDHNFGKFTRLVKADYHRNIRYEDKSSEEVFARFYYNEKQLFIVNLTEIISDGKNQKTINHDIDVSKLNTLKNDAFIFTDDIKKWIIQVDNSIIKLNKKTSK